MQPTNFISSAAAAPTSGYASWQPLDVGPVAITIQSLGVQCSVAQVGGATTVTLGIYADNGTGGAPLLTPGGLLGSVTVDPSTVGLKSVALPLTLQPGRYWLAFLYVATTAPTTNPQFLSANFATSLWLQSSASSIASAVRALLLPSQTALPTVAGNLLGSGAANHPVVCARLA